MNHAMKILARAKVELPSVATRSGASIPVPATQTQISLTPAKSFKS